MSSDELYKKISEYSNKAPENRHSYYQLKYFVLGKEPTTQSQLWQCLRELQSRKEVIDNLKFQIEDTHDEIELVNIDIEKMQMVKVADTKREVEIKIKRLKRKQESLLCNINNLENKLKFTFEEARFFLDAFEKLNELENLRDYDDYDAQKEYWEAKISEEINLRILTKQPLPPELIKTAISLHEGSDIKNQVNNILENCRNFLEASCNNEKKQLNH